MESFDCQSRKYGLCLVLVRRVDFYDRKREGEPGESPGASEVLSSGKFKCRNYELSERIELISRGH